MSGSLISIQSYIAEYLGLDHEIVKESAPVLYEMGLRVGDALKDVAADADPSREAFALAQAMCAAIIMEAASEELDQNLDDFCSRLLEAANRGLFDISPTEVSPRLNALFNQHLSDDEE